MPQSLFSPILTLLTGMLLVSGLPAQVLPHSCATDLYQAYLASGDPGLATRTRVIDVLLKEQTEAASRLRVQEDTTWLNIPIAFHILHANGPENLHDSLIHRAVADLNDGFANRGFYDPGTGVPVHISFCLSQKGKYGEPSSGINRLYVPGLLELTGFEQDADMKRTYSWPTDRVLNIYSVGNISFATAYASLPQLEEGHYAQGIVIDAPFVGYSQSRSAVLIHEVGHFLGLYHTFQDNCRNYDCLLQGDRVCDTPPDASWTVYEGCQTNNNCFSDADDTSPNNPFTADGPDMNTNYMDYNDFGCQKEFSPGQRRRMRFAAHLLRPRLLGSNNCAPGLAYDAFIHEIQSPVGRICGDNISPRIRIANGGSLPMVTLEIHYGLLGGPEYSYSWRGPSLPGGSFAWVDLPAIPTPGPGRHHFQVRLSRPNNIADPFPANDTIRSEIWSLQEGFVPYLEDFEDGLPHDWVSLHDTLHSWELAATGSCDAAPGENQALYLLNRFYTRPGYNTYITPLLDLDRHEDAVLSFDFSFARQAELDQRQYLLVEAIPACGEGDPVELWLKPQTGLMQAIVNDLSYIWTPTTCEHWDHKTLDLSQFSGQRIAIAFTTNIGRQDYERLYLDNIRVTSSYAKEKSLNGIDESDIRLSPVPNDGAFTLDLPVFAATEIRLELYDATGRRVWQEVENVPPSRFLRHYDLRGLASGVYFLRIRMGEERFVKKMTVYF